MKNNSMIKLFTLSIVTCGIMLPLTMQVSDAHTKCKRRFPWGGWTEGCPHVHPGDTPRPGGRPIKTGYQTNKFDLKRKVENGGWTVSWATDISETDAIKGVVASGVSVYATNPAPFYAWVESLVNRTINSLSTNMSSQLRNRAKQIARQVIYAAVRGKSPKEIFRRFDTVDFKAGAIRYSGRNYAGNFTVSRTWGLKPYVAFRVRSSRRSSTRTLRGRKF